VNNTQQKDINLTRIPWLLLDLPLALDSFCANSVTCDILSFKTSH